MTAAESSVALGGYEVCLCADLVRHSMPRPIATA